jgi:hypothetical protein
MTGKEPSWSKKKNSQEPCWVVGFACARNRSGRIRDHEPPLSPPGLIQTGGKKDRVVK